MVKGVLHENMVMVLLSIVSIGASYIGASSVEVPGSNIEAMSHVSWL